MVTFFDVIDTSAPHIYHSALLLSPRKSIVRERHGLYARPLAKVVHGLSTSWEPAAAVLFTGSNESAVAWSPCGGFIARSVRKPAMVEILDATTLGKIKALRSSSGSTQLLDFSPDGRTLIRFGKELELTSWDLQTGGVICTIPPETRVANPRCLSSAHSKDGRIVAVAYTASFDPPATTAISTYDLISRRPIYSYHSEERIIASIWTHGDRLRFASVRPEYITIREVDFTSIDTLAEVETLPLPEGISRAKEFLFLPTLSRLAAVLTDAIQVWDVQNSKLLLNSLAEELPTDPIAFSPGGQAFACNCGWYFRTWRESPTGYTVHQDYYPDFLAYGRSLFSPSGALIIFSGLYSLEIRDIQVPTPSRTPGQNQPSRPGIFLLGFSPDETSAAVVRLREKIVTVLDLESGEPRLTIDTGTEVLCLGVAGTTIAVVCRGKIVTWNLLGEGRAFNTRASTDDSVQTTVVDSAQPLGNLLLPNISISPDLKRVAIIRGRQSDEDVLDISDTSIGECLTGTTSIRVGEVSMPRFTADGCKVWVTRGDRSAGGYKIIEGDECNSIRLEPIEPGTFSLEGFPWRSARHYEVVDDGWVRNLSGKRLLWLPHSWRSVKEFRTWKGRFLGLLHSSLPEAVILEFYE